MLSPLYPSLAEHTGRGVLFYSVRKLRFGVRGKSRVSGELNCPLTPRVRVRDYVNTIYIPSCA